YRIFDEDVMGAEVSTNESSPYHNGPTSPAASGGSRRFHPGDVPESPASSSGASAQQRPADTPRSTGKHVLQANGLSEAKPPVDHTKSQSAKSQSASGVSPGKANDATRSSKK
ncbi:unnamed protein product, partial [Candidula unifasciata]